MKVIVTGANGFLGSTLINKLFLEGHEIFAVVRNPNEDVRNILGKCKIIYSEICCLKEELKSQNISDVDAFYHFAWQGVNGAKKGDPFVQNDNVSIALYAADSAKSVNCRRFLVAGTIAEQSLKSIPSLRFASPSVIYAAAKVSCRVMLEAYCKYLGLKLIWMQLPNIYGLNNKTGNLLSYAIEAITKGEPAAFGPAAQPYDFVFIDDLIEAVSRLCVCKCNKDFYYIGSGQPRILASYLSSVGQIFKRPELIKIGARPDDGIRYTMDMFLCEDAINDIGQYISGTFEDHMSKIASSLGF